MQIYELGTMFAWRATCCQRPSCFIHIPVKRRFSVFPTFGIFPPRQRNLAARDNHGVAIDMDVLNPADRRK